MAKAKVKGVVMEIMEKKEINRVTNQEETVVTARLYQKGQKSMLDVKRVPAGLSEGELVELPVLIFAWATKSGQANLALSYDYDEVN